MSNDLVKAAAPAIVAVLQAFNQFIVNLGTDPAQIAAKFPGAVQVFLGTAELQLPAVITAELDAVQTDVQAKVAALIAKLQASAA